MKVRSKEWLVVGVVVAFLLGACDQKGGNGGGAASGDIDGDGVPDITDVFPDNPLLGSLSTSLSSGQELIADVTKEQEAKAVTSNNAMAIGWCDNPAPTILTRLDSLGEFPMVYVDKTALAARCPAAPDPAYDPDCGGTTVTFKDVAFSDGRIDFNVEGDPTNGWAFFFRYNKAQETGYDLSLSPDAHRWANWSGGEWFPYGLLNLSSLNSMTLPSPPDGPGGKRATMIAGKTFKNKLTQTSHHIAIEAFGSKITVYDNDVLAFETEDSDWTSGAIGFRVGHGACLKVHNVNIADKLPGTTP